MRRRFLRPHEIGKDPSRLLWYRYAPYCRQNRISIAATCARRDCAGRFCCNWFEKTVFRGCDQPIMQAPPSMTKWAPVTQVASSEHR